jgi:hypothetical protein
MTDPQLTLATDWVKILGAVVVFGIGLQRYSQAQKWKRGEFIAAQIKDFEADRKIQLMMTMLDWSDRELYFPSDTGKDPIAIRVGDALLCSALLPHNNASGYYPNEMTIRDCVDRYLDMLMRLQNFVDAGLIKIDELRPYIKYWIELASGQLQGHHRKEVFVLLLNYIQTYSFVGAARLIRAFGYDPSPSQDAVDKAIADALKNRQHPKDQNMLS